MSDQCKCSLTVKLNGDGCKHCNPQYFIDILKDEIEEKDADLKRAISGLKLAVSHIESEVCYHEETHRGGVLWEICNACGAKWADDEGGKPEDPEPEHLKSLRTTLEYLEANHG